jgi:hypothetical protein
LAIEDVEAEVQQFPNGNVGWLYPLAIGIVGSKVHPFLKGKMHANAITDTARFLNIATEI